MVHSALVHEVAITMAYAMIEKDRSSAFEAASRILAGYTAVLPLTPREHGLLHTLVASRLCQSAVMSAYSFAQDPTNTYLLVTAEPGWRVLEWLAGMSAAEIAAFNAGTWTSA